MKNIFILEDLDCANCAAKIENEVMRIDGVENAAISLFTQKLTVESELQQDKKFLKQIKKIVKKYEPDVEVSEV